LTDPYSEYYTDDWKVIVVPALDENGKSFCESVKTTEEYHQIKKVTPDFIWEAEYMQNPIESKGLLFPIEDLNRFSMKELAGKEPDGIFGFTDTADEGTDYLCSIIGKMYGNRIYITDVIFNQDPIEVTQPEVAGMIINTECELMKIESNNGGKGYAREIRRLIEGKSTCGIIYEPTTKNKETRILMNSGNIKNYFWFRNDYEPGSQYDSYMRALTSYVRLGKNKHDDAPDATTALWEYTKDYITTDKYKSIRRKAINRFDEDLYDDEEEEFSMYTI
jgi:predicted phage terminase large subunit-like protein